MAAGQDFWDLVDRRQFHRIDGFLGSLASSTLTQQDVNDMAHNCNIWSEDYEVEAPENVERIYSRMDNGWFGVYADVLEAGFRLPTPSFIRELLGMYKVAPAQLAPNAWRVVIGFVCRCRERRIVPTIRLWRSIFTYKQTSGQGRGWIYFSPRGKKMFADSGPSAIHDWKRKFFFVRAKRPELRLQGRWMRPATEPQKAAVLTELELANKEKLLKWECPSLARYLTESRQLLVLADARGEFLYPPEVALESAAGLATERAKKGKRKAPEAGRPGVGIREPEAEQEPRQRLRQATTPREAGTPEQAGTPGQTSTPSGGLRGIVEPERSSPRTPLQRRRRVLGELDSRLGPVEVAEEVERREEAPRESATPAGVGEARQGPGVALTPETGAMVLFEPARAAVPPVELALRVTAELVAEGETAETARTTGPAGERGSDAAEAQRAAERPPPMVIEVESTSADRTVEGSQGQEEVGSAQLGLQVVEAGGEGPSPREAHSAAPPVRVEPAPPNASVQALQGAAPEDIRGKGVDEEEEEEEESPESPRSGPSDWSPSAIVSRSLACTAELASLLSSLGRYHEGSLHEAQVRRKLETELEAALLELKETKEKAEEEQNRSRDLLGASSSKVQGLEEQLKASVAAQEELKGRLEASEAAREGAEKRLEASEAARKASEGRNNVLESRLGSLTKMIDNLGRFSRGGPSGSSLS